ncbi:MAG: hypothetical protein HN509_00905 [Halobacteriovoraceae bacterium]|jgi:hypothetical protein|nr:hypothetical protein [Halobacteriovoraceae bacterium]MBT5094230.1 hypothetical protein [Halobacteriovoraceae bacterium]
MRLPIGIILILFQLSSPLMASGFGVLPSSYFGPQAEFGCDSPDACALPERQQLIKIGEEFLGLSSERAQALSQIEVALRDRSTLLNEWINEYDLTKSSGPYRLLLADLSQQFIDLIEKRQHASLLHAVSGRSQFLQELNQLTRILAEFDSKIALADESNKEQLKAEKWQKYRQFRLEGKFESYQNIDHAQHLLSEFLAKGVDGLLEATTLALGARYLKVSDCQNSSGVKTLSAISIVAKAPQGFKRKHFNIFQQEDRKTLKELFKDGPLTIQCQQNAARFGPENNLLRLNPGQKGPMLLKFITKSL